MAKRSIDTCQDISSAQRAAAEHTGAEPRHVERPAADVWRERPTKTSQEPAREGLWDARPAPRKI
jgi:hypothetical protein